MKKRKRFSGFCSFLAAGFVAVCIALTGCEGREADFLLEEDGKEFPQGDETEADAVTAGNGREAEEVSDAAPVPQKTQIYVDVCGAVVNPGVFAMAEGSRVFQAVDAAGGFLPDAAEAYVNRAQCLADGQQVYIPTTAETEEWQALGGTAFPAENPGGAGQGMSEAGAGSGKVNLNTADEAGLTALNGIGPARARAIVTYREENGPFSAIEDIMKVQGIKEGTFAKIKDDIVVG